jgi:hypothetical protein
VREPGGETSPTQFFETLVRVTVQARVAFSGEAYRA